MFENKLQIKDNRENERKQNKPKKKMFNHFTQMTDNNFRICLKDPLRLPLGGHLPFGIDESIRI